MLRIRRMREYLHSGMADYIYDTLYLKCLYN